MNKRVDWTHGVLGLALALVVISLLARGAVLFWTPNYNVAAEANGLHGILELKDGRTLYPPRSVRPYNIFLYPPVHAFFAVSVMKTLGVSELRAAVLTTRALSLLCFLAALGIFYRVFLRPAGVSAIGIVLAFALAFSKFSDYVTSSRNDMLCLLLEIGGLALLVTWLRSQKTRDLMLFIVATVLAVWTRQTGMEVGIVAVLYLLGERRYRQAVTVGAILFVLNAAVLSSLLYFTDGIFWEQVVLSNVRSWRPINRQLLDASFVTFLLSYALFAFLLGRSLFKEKRGVRGEPAQKVLALTVAVSTLLAATVFLRAGGDVNYFFLPIFVGTYFVAQTLEALREKQGIPRWLALAGSAQLILIAVAFGFKTQSAWKSGQYPYDEAARRLVGQFGPHIYLTGFHGQALTIYIRPLALHGPDVTNAGYVAQNAHPSFRWLLKDAEEQLAAGKVSAVAIANPGCAQANPTVEPTWRPNLYPLEEWYPWLCVFRSRVYGQNQLALKRP